MRSVVFIRVHVFSTLARYSDVATQSARAHTHTQRGERERLVSRMLSFQEYHTVQMKTHHINGSRVLYAAWLLTYH